MATDADMDIDMNIDMEIDPEVARMQAEAEAINARAQQQAAEAAQHDAMNGASTRRRRSRTQCDRTSQSPPTRLGRPHNPEDRGRRARGVRLGSLPQTAMD
jgi:hypothetical protein